MATTCTFCAKKFLYLFLALYFSWRFRGPLETGKVNVRDFLGFFLAFVLKSSDLCALCAHTQGLMRTHPHAGMCHTSMHVGARSHVYNLETKGELGSAALREVEPGGGFPNFR